MKRYEIFPAHLIDRFKEEGFQRVIEEEKREFERELKFEDEGVNG
jgi:succinate dehydrogenase flavin-adding protein (antitoxin of CptAB toxin-antitoxin module)